MGKVSNPYNFNPKDDYRSYSEISKNQAEFQLFVGKSGNYYGFNDFQGSGGITYLSDNYIYGWKISALGSDLGRYLDFYGAKTSDNSSSSVTIIINDSEKYTGTWDGTRITLSNSKKFSDIVSKYYNQSINIKIIASNKDKIIRNPHNLSCYFIYAYPDTYKSITDIKPYIEEINNLKPLILNKFLYRTKIENIDLTGLDYSTLTNFNELFYGTTIRSIKAPKFSNKTVANMFNNASLYTNITTENLDFSSVTNLGALFKGADDINEDTTITIDASSATSTSQMFDCAGMISVTEPKGILTLLNTSKLTNMGYMFDACYWFKTVNEFDTSHATNMSFAFRTWGPDRDMVTWEIDLSSCTQAGNIRESHTTINPIKLKNVPRSLGLTSNNNYTIINYID